MVSFSDSNPISSTKSTAGASGEITSVLVSWATNTTLTGHATTVRNIHSRLRAVLPEQLDGEFPSNIGKLQSLIKLDADTQHLSLALYLISNNMLPAESFNTMIKFLQQQRNLRLLRSLLSTKTSAVEAFAEKLLIAAAKAESDMIIKEILEAGIDPNVWDMSGRKTPLHYVVESGSTELVEALLDAGADVNALATDEEDVPIGNSAL